MFTFIPVYNWKRSQLSFIIKLQRDFINRLILKRWNHTLLWALKFTNVYVKFIRVLKTNYVSNKAFCSLSDPKNLFLLYQINMSHIIIHNAVKSRSKSETVKYIN